MSFIISLIIINNQVLLTNINSFKLRMTLYVRYFFGTVKAVKVYRLPRGTLDLVLDINTGNCFLFILFAAKCGSFNSPFISRHNYIKLIHYKKLTMTTCKKIYIFGSEFQTVQVIVIPKIRQKYIGQVRLRHHAFTLSMT